MRNPHRYLLGTALLAAAVTASAGTVNVSFVEPSRYVDAGNSAWDEEDNMKALSGYLQALGQRYLPPNQVLKVEVLDLDLAGTVRPSRRDGDSIRIVKGRTDYPRINVRFTLEADGKVLQRGEEWVLDMNYTRGLSVQRDYSGLVYEKRMLASWFRQRFGDLRTAAG
jgi:hypothetical protein